MPVPPIPGASISDTITFNTPVLVTLVGKCDATDCEHNIQFPAVEQDDRDLRELRARIFFWS